MRHLLPLLVTPALIAPAFATAPSQAQITEFSDAFGKAWQAGDLKGLLATMADDGLSESARDSRAGYWGLLLKMAKEKPAPWGGVEFLSLEEGLTQKPGRNIDAYRSMVEPRTINGRRYVPNLPAVGSVSLKVFGKSGITSAVGLTADGKLKLIDHKAEQPGDLKRPEAIPFQGLAKAPPSAEAVARFTQAAKAALAEKTLLPIAYTQGAPLDGLDKQQWQMLQFLNHNGSVITEVEFTPVDANARDLPEQAREAAPYGSVWYALNLPYAGKVKISTKDNDGSGGSISTAAGLTPEGELKLPALVPVIPPTQ